MKRPKTTPVERHVCLRGDLVRTYRKHKGWTAADLAAKVGCSKRTIENVEADRSVRVHTASWIAEALGVDIATLTGVTGDSANGAPIAAKPERHVITPITLGTTNFEGFKADDAKRILEELVKVLGLDEHDEVIMLAIKRGCVILEVEMSEETYAKLVTAFRDGKLERLGITDVGEAEPVSHTPPITQRKGVAASAKRIAYLAKAACILGLLCGLSGCVPVNAKPFYIAGIALSCGGAVLCYLARLRLIWWIAPLVLNAAALAAWPTVIGFFSTREGIRFRVDQRMGSMQATVSIGWKGRLLTWQQTRELRVYINGKEIEWWNTMISIPFQGWLHEAAARTQEHERELMQAVRRQEFPDYFAWQSITVPIHETGNVDIICKYKGKEIGRHRVFVRPYSGPPNQIPGRKENPPNFGFLIDWPPAVGR